MTYHEQKIESWRQEDLAISARLTLCVNKRSGEIETSPDMRRDPEIAIKAAHLQYATKRFLEIMEDHIYWTKRWIENA